jgi:hypothetical protein
VLAFFASQPRCLVAMEACAGGHHWAWEIGALGQPLLPQTRCLRHSRINGALPANLPADVFPA